MVNNLVIGTINKAIALAQTNYVMMLLKNYCKGINFRIKIIKVPEVKEAKNSFNVIEANTIFFEEIKQALSRGEIDIGVLSLKFIPIELPESVCIGAVPERGDVRDAFISKDINGWNSLPAGSVIGVNDIRIASQLLRLRPDWNVKKLAGDINIKWKKLEHGDYDGIIVELLELKYFGLLSEFVYPLDVSEFIPSIGQGAIGIQIMKERFDMRELVGPINDINTYICISAERQFIKKLRGNGYSGIGANANIIDNKLSMIGFVSSPDGKRFIYDSVIIDDIYSFELIANELADRLIKKGANDIINEAINREYK